MELVFATHNHNKLQEVQLLMPRNIKLLSLTDIGCNDDIPETQPTIEGNAKQKADFVTKNYGYDCFADDTGLEVAVLGGAPGVLSARYAGPEKIAEANMDKLLNALKHQSNRHAHFKTVIALHLNARYHEFLGICEGKITSEKHGKQGFGYDPIFQPLGYQKTFAQMSMALKNSIGHRGKAIAKLIQFLSR